MFRKKTPLAGQARPTRPFMNAVKVRKTFTCEGYAFRAGSMQSMDSELVQKIVAAYPDYFESANR